MKPSRTPVLFLAATLVGAAFVLPLSAKEKNDVPDVLATVNGKPITKEMFALYYQEKLKKIPGTKNTPENQMASINELINSMLLAQDAKAKKLDKNPAIAAALQLEEAQLLTRAAIQDYLKKHQPSEKELRKEYKKTLAGKTKKEYKARHILVKTEKEAKEIIKQLDKGADFAKLAKEKSTGPSGKTGGELGWFSADQMVEPFSKAVEKMKKGTYTKTPVKTQFGWHVILLEDKRETPPPTFKQAKKQLSLELRRKALEQYISGLRKKAKIKFNAAAGEPKKK